jgi:hypothetical protein
MLLAAVEKISGSGSSPAAVFFSSFIGRGVKEPLVGAQI